MYLMDKRDQRLNARLTRKDKTALKELAKRADVSISQFLTDFVRREAKLKGIRL